MTEIAYPVWRQRLASSLQANSSEVHSKYYQVASVCPNGRPKNRTMVFRGFLPGTQNLLSVTDFRSDKIEQWQSESKSRFETCWYFSDSREQFRLAGEVALISNALDSSYGDSVLGEQTKDGLLKQQWSNLSVNAREPFYSSSPKAPFDDSSKAPMAQDGVVAQGHNTNKTSDKNIAGGQFEMNDNFCVVIFIPHTVDYLNLKSKPQQRCLYDIQDDWKEQAVNP
jgi:pyridoxamine 5'-phosphate oxidase